jgi:hypothetical protein
LELARDHWWRSVGMSVFARRRVSSVGESGEHRAKHSVLNNAA